MIKSILIPYLLLLTVQIDGSKREIFRKNPQGDKKSVETWKGVWFPERPWTNRWFPHPPYRNGEPTLNKHYKKQLDASEACDDGKHFIGIDFDPSDIRQTFEHLCIADRNLYTPNMNRKALLTEHSIPPAYKAPIKCLNESIDYYTKLPTYGAFRPLMPKYGSYIFLPAQRWLAAMSRGAIIMLYHPCAFGGQVKLLQNTLSGCLYRHIITPSQILSPERPLALLAWGKSLEISVVDDHLVVDFIKKNAKQGPNYLLKVGNDNRTYDAGLLQEAHLITDENDSEICGYKREM